MKHINVRGLRTEMPSLRETLVQEHEMLLVSNGKPLARMLPVIRKRPFVSLAAHRNGMKPVAVSSEVLLREERSGR